MVALNFLNFRKISAYTSYNFSKEQFQTRTERLIVELRNLQSDEIDSVYKSNAILRYTKAAIQTPILALPYGNCSLYYQSHLLVSLFSETELVIVSYKDSDDSQLKLKKYPAKSKITS